MNEPIHEITVLSTRNDMTISLVLCPDRVPSRWEVAEIEDAPTLDAFDRFMAGKAGD